jgi:hypothetical protein
MDKRDIAMFACLLAFFIFLLALMNRGCGNCLPVNLSSPPTDDCFVMENGL